MPKNKSKRINPSDNAQEKLQNAAESIPGDNRNQNHNVKKVALGPNTKR